MKFLKREKKADMTELDLPPEPPPLEGFEDKQDFELPEINADEFDMSKFDIPNVKIQDAYQPKMPEMKYNDAPDFPEFPEMEEPQSYPQPEMPRMPQMPSQPSAVPQTVQPMPPDPMQEEMPQSDPQQQPRRRLFRHENVQREMRSRKEVYVRIDRFKAVLDDINMIRANARKSDEALIRLEGIKSSKDRAFDRVKSSLADLQKKLIFIDKTLFKGD